MKTGCPDEFDHLPGERNIIRKRIIAGQKADKRWGVCFGRPEVEVDTNLVSRFEKQGLSWHSIAEQTGIPNDTLIRHHEA